MKVPVHRKRAHIPRRRLWKLSDPNNQESFQAALRTELGTYAENTSTTEGIWGHFKNSLLRATDKVCGWTKKRGRKLITWWWNDTVKKAVSEKRIRWKEWKRGGKKEPYLLAKRISRLAVYNAKKKAELDKIRDVVKDKNTIFRLAKQMKRDNRDVVGDTCVKDSVGNMCLNDETKKKAWQTHYERLLNEEFTWNADTLSPVYPIAGPPVLVTKEMVMKAISTMKPGKAPGPSGVAAEMLKASAEDCAGFVAKLTNCMISEGKIPSE